MVNGLCKFSIFFFLKTINLRSHHYWESSEMIGTQLTFSSCNSGSCIHSPYTRPTKTYIRCVRYVINNNTDSLITFFPRKCFQFFFYVNRRILIKRHFHFIGFSIQFHSWKHHVPSDEYMTVTANMRNEYKLHYVWWHRPNVWSCWTNKPNKKTNSTK